MVRWWHTRITANSDGIFHFISAVAYGNGAVYWFDVMNEEHARILNNCNEIDWSQWVPTMHATLLFVIHDEKILLMRKKRGIGEGKINGPGGKIDPGESAVECAVRETAEELLIDVAAADVEKMGELFFQFRDGLGIHCSVFTASEFIGQPGETEEGDPEWYPLDSVPYAEMWADDIHWMPRMLDGEVFCGQFIFDGDCIVDSVVEFGAIGEANWEDACGTGYPRYAEELNRV